MLSSEFPVISLAGIDEVDGRRSEIFRKFVEACEDWVIFQFVNHSVDPKLVDEITRLARDFFTLASSEREAPISATRKVDSDRL